MWLQWENEVRGVGRVGPSICQIKEFVFSQGHWSALKGFKEGDDMIRFVS